MMSGNIYAKIFKASPSPRQVVMYLELVLGDVWEERKKQS